MQDALSAYTAEIKFKTQRNWKIPENSAGLSARVAFRVSKTGIISGIRIVESSGDKDFDATIVEALRSITVSAPPDNSSHNVSILFNAS
jgi:colicin import membrane protein